MVEVTIKDLIGKVMKSVEDIAGREIIFTTEDGRQYQMYHQQDCCESVYIESIIGDLDDLVGSPILMAEESSFHGKESLPVHEQVRVKIQKASTPYYCTDESQTWTFYKFATSKGYVDIRWLGESSGYYSEEVYFRVLDN
jgi:hypothetical protein